MFLRTERLVRSEGLAVRQSFVAVASRSSVGKAAHHSSAEGVRRSSAVEVRRTTVEEAEHRMTVVEVVRRVLLDREVRHTHWAGHLPIVVAEGVELGHTVLVVRRIDWEGVRHTVPAEAHHTD